MPVLRRPVEPAALFGHGAMSAMSLLSGVKRKSRLTKCDEAVRLVASNASAHLHP
jgi:hypothetical protein